VDHVFLTRFNLPTGGREQLIRAQEGWLRKRALLFEGYCLPSMAAQTNRDFKWLIYFDPESPAWLLEKVRQWSAEGEFSPVLRASVDRAELISDLKRLIGEGRSQMLLTTNLDNDDGLSSDFVDRLQHAASGTNRRAIYLTRGLILSDSRLYLNRDRGNAFCSVVEPWNEATTCWLDWHNLLGRHMDVQEVDGSPGWLQVVHGGNVSNRVHGRLVAADEFASRFPPLPAILANVGRGELLAEALFLHPVRSAKDQIRLGAKWLLMKCVGKDGLDEIKSVLVGLRRRTVEPAVAPERRGP
jgi:hypothetical protein